MFTPWLVYANYPRKQKINYFYVIKKMFMVAMLLLTIYLIYSEWIQPWIHKSISIQPVELILRLMLPTTVFIILGFYLVFETMCNFFSEITKLDHR